MASTKRAAPEQGAATALPALPPVTVAKMRHALALLDRLYEANRDEFMARMADHRDAARAHTTRPLTAGESMALALEAAPRVGVTDPDAVTALAAGVQDSELRMVDEPRGEEIFAAAISALGTAMFDAAVRFVALVELDNDQLEQAAEAGRLDELLDERVREIGRSRGRDVRVRATRAWQAVQAEWGLDSGEALGRLARPVWGALMQAASQMGDRISASSTPSLASTDGPEGMSSTTSGGATP